MINQDSFELLLEDPDLKEELKRIVLARLNSLPSDVSLSLGSHELDKKDLLNHVQEEDVIGKQIMEIQLKFLQDMASGTLLDNE